MKLDTLKNAGLTPAEIKIYESLLENGGQTAGQIITTTALKRGDAYNKIYDLINKGLVLESEKNKKKYFELSSPEKIDGFIETQKENLELTQKEIKSILPNIVSSYNLAYHKPGMKFFEGEDGMKKIMADSLTAQTEILSFVDPKAVDQNIAQDNRRYVNQRKKMKIKKKLLVTRSEYNLKRFAHYNDKLTEVRYIDQRPVSSFTSMQIYDNKISYQTLSKNALMGIIIEDKNIATMHRELFKFIWEKAKKS